MIRGSKSALAPAHTAQLLSYSLLVSDFASWFYLCHLQQLSPTKAENQRMHRTVMSVPYNEIRVCRLLCFKVFFKHLWQMFCMFFSLTEEEKSLTQNCVAWIIKFQQKLNFQITEGNALYKRSYIVTVEKNA